MAGMSFAQGEKLIGLMTEIRDALVTGRAAVDQLTGAKAPMAPMRFACASCGNAAEGRLGHQGSKTWHCLRCGASGHLPQDAVI